MRKRKDIILLLEIMLYNGECFNSEDIILITGASSGIGRQVCQDLNKSGAFVIAVARDIQKLESLNREIEFPENFAFEQKDLSKEPENLKYGLKIFQRNMASFGLGLIAGIQNISQFQA